MTVVTARFELRETTVSEKQDRLDHLWINHAAELDSVGFRGGIAPDASDDAEFMFEIDSDDPTTAVRNALEAAGLKVIWVTTDRYVGYYDYYLDMDREGQPRKVEGNEE